MHGATTLIFHFIKINVVTELKDIKSLITSSAEFQQICGQIKRRLKNLTRKGSQYIFKVIETLMEAG
jgi:hypothetical protein